MKRIFKIIGKIIISLLLLIVLLTGFIFLARKVNQSKIEEATLAYYTHPRKRHMQRLSPENIGARRRKFYGDYIRGHHYIPNNIRHKGVVVTFGGSEGSMNEYMANYLSSDGYEVVAVYYFGQEGQSDRSESVPLEIYEEIYSYIRNNCRNSDIVTILGTSKGAELALLLSTYYDSIDNVVLFAPSAYVSAGTNLDENSSWTYNGKDVDFLKGNLGVIPMIRTGIDLLLNKPHDQLILMNSKLNSSENLEEARIKVENSNAKILIFYGGDDRALDAKSYSEIIEKHAKKETIVHGYENAGHVFGGNHVIKVAPLINMLNGGDIDSNIEADLDSKRILLETLELWHSKENK